MASGGWIKLHRKSKDSDVFRDPVMWKVWTWCLMKATHVPADIEMSTGRGRVKVHLEPGQFAFGRSKAEQELNIPGATIWRKLVSRQNGGKLIMQVNRHYSLITICNWNKYQAGKKAFEQASEQANEQASEHIQEED